MLCTKRSRASRKEHWTACVGAFGCTYVRKVFTVSCPNPDFQDAKHRLLGFRALGLKETPNFKGQKTMGLRST